MHPEPYAGEQVFWPQRLWRMVRQRLMHAPFLVMYDDEQRQRLHALDRAIVSTYSDCVALGLESEAKRELERLREVTA